MGRAYKLINGKISERQFMVLVFLYTVGTTILVIPSGMAAAAKQDAWIGALAGVCLAPLMIWLYAALWRLFPDKTFVGICEAVLGKWLGLAVSVLFSFYSFIGAATVLFYVGNFFKTHFIPNTPPSFTNILFAIVVVMGVRLGLEALSRTAELMLPWIVLLFVILVATLTPEIKFENVQPVLETGIKPILMSGLSFAGTAYMPVVFLFALFPCVQNQDKARKRLFTAALIGGMCVVLVTALCILILGADITARSMFPSYALVKKINIGGFLQRIEAILAGLWFITTYIKTTFYFYGWVSSFAEILKLNEYRSVTMPFGIIMVVFSLVVYPDVVYMQKWDSTVFLPYILTMGLFIPLLLLAVGRLRKK
ncbi:spore gernimation protein [Paenibacillus mesophilus]|uniref:GerAB/ArcD/ProY family transporter n=1 Tax=Paenibacillus mesophilus TaxID=2582849 RepID=UPI00110D5A32|nr:endospore germination permease [Paenibacillus mesophilus]TMV46968.1 spore gernimation protein [Paenibacillus mesophilus]